MSAHGSSPSRTIVYCVVPGELAGALHEPLRRHFADDPCVEVVVEQRWRDRRWPEERRAAETKGEMPGEERRRIRAATGRRVADRRADIVMAVPPEDLPRKVRSFADRLTFVRRVEPSSEELEDRDTARLVARFQAGDREVFESLYLRYFDRVYAYLALVLCDAHEAEDATQHVFSRLWQILDAYERRNQPFRAWLFVVVRNHGIDVLRRLRRTDLVEPEVANRLSEGTVDADGFDVLDWVSDRELTLLMSRLPLSQRQVLALRYLVDLNDQQIAAVLERSPADVRMLQARALRFLRERLVAMGRSTKSAPRARMRRTPRHSTVLRTRRWALLS